MKSYERELFIKSFILFFGVQVIFLSIIMFQHYQKVFHEYEMEVQAQTISIDINTSNQEYIIKKKDILTHVTIEYMVYIFVLFIISVFFSMYATYPLRKALKLNDEFVKDILHDFNTPLASLNINHKILKKKFGEDDALKRSEEAIANILSMQTNLHFFLNQSKLTNDYILLQDVINKRISYFKILFSSLKFSSNINNIKLYTNENAFIRVLDNLLSNAGKYNKENGFIKIYMEKNILTIEDSGIGIKNPKKIFDRYYKENETGIGLGLHIVKKLCNELGIKIQIKTSSNKGTLISLDLSNILFSSNV